MAGDRVTIATVPDAATAELLREVLSDGGVLSVELRAATGLAYMPRSSSLEYEVRVDEDDEVAARQVLRAFEEDSGQAATSQAADASAVAAAPLGTSTEQLDEHRPPRRNLVRIVGFAMLLLLVLPLLLQVLFHLFAGADAPDPS